jgi:hypothetical protein
MGTSKETRAPAFSSLAISNLAISSLEKSLIVAGIGFRRRGKLVGMA